MSKKKPIIVNPGKKISTIPLPTKKIRNNDIDRFRDHSEHKR